MKKVKKIIICTMLLLAVCLTGCKNNKSKGGKTDNNEYIKNLPSMLKDDEYIICMNKFNMEMLNGVGGSICLYILSKENLENKNVKFNVDTDVDYELVFASSKHINEKFTDSVCLLYNDFDWEKFTSDDFIYSKEYDELTAKIEKEYEALDADDFPQFYCNKYFLNFDYDGGFDETIREAEIVIEDKSYPIELGQIIFSERDNYNSEENVLEFEEYGRQLVNITQDKEGLIKLRNYTMVALKDVTVKNIRLFNKQNNISVESAEFTYEADGNTFNQKYEPGMEINIPAGSKVKVDFVFKDTDFAGEQNYTVNVFWGIEYECEGTAYTVTTYANCASYYNSQLMYAIFKDNLNISEYLNAYGVSN